MNIASFKNDETFFDGFSNILDFSIAFSSVEVFEILWSGVATFARNSLRSNGLFDFLEQ